MTKLFRDLIVGDKLYWVLPPTHNFGFVKVEEYTVLSVKNVGKDCIVVEVQGNFSIKLPNTSCVHKRPNCESYYTLDEDGVIHCVNKIKRHIVEGYQEEIKRITDKMQDVLLREHKVFKQWK